MGAKEIKRQSRPLAPATRGDVIAHALEGMGKDRAWFLAWFACWDSRPVDFRRLLRDRWPIDETMARALVKTVGVSVEFWLGREELRKPVDVGCRAARGIFLDMMDRSLTAEESEALRLHKASCHACETMVERYLRFSAKHSEGPDGD